MYQRWAEHFWGNLVHKNPVDHPTLWPLRCTRLQETSPWTSDFQVTVKTFMLFVFYNDCPILQWQKTYLSDSFHMGSLQAFQVMANHANQPHHRGRALHRTCEFWDLGQRQRSRPRYGLLKISHCLCSIRALRMTLADSPQKSHLCRKEVAVP